MQYSYKVLVFILFLSININAQIIECRLVDNIKIGIQFAKFKSEELRSQDGTVYKKAGFNYKENISIFRAITEHGIDEIKFHNIPTYSNGLEMFKMASITEFTNGMVKEATLLCYDLKEINKKRMDNKKSPITVKDYE